MSSVDHQAVSWSTSQIVVDGSGCSCLVEKSLPPVISFASVRLFVPTSVGRVFDNPILSTINLLVRQSVRQFVVRPSVCPSDRPSVRPSVSLSLRPTVRASVCPSVRLSICTSRLFICPLIRTSDSELSRPSVSPVRPSVRPPVRYSVRTACPLLCPYRLSIASIRLLLPSVRPLSVRHLVRPSTIRTSLHSSFHPPSIRSIRSFLRPAPTV